LKVAVLAGGRLSEREVSLSTAAVVRAALTEAGHVVIPVSIDQSGSWSSDDEQISVSPGGGLLGCDVAFPALRGPFGEDGTVQGMLELLNVPYVGAGVLASSLCMDQAAFKQTLAACGVPQVGYVVVPERRWRHSADAVRAVLDRFGMPAFVKPARLGSTVGAVKLTDPEQLDEALETAFSHGGVAVIEEYSSGIQVECGVIGLGEPEISVPGVVVRRGVDRFAHHARHARLGRKFTAPAPLPAAVTAKVQGLACETFRRVGCAGLARVDFFVEGAHVLVREVDTLPAFTPTSDFPQLWRASGVELPALCDRLLAFALERHHIERGVHAF
jgi:D-alanine-D-alanine ligase